MNARTLVGLLGRDPGSSLEERMKSCRLCRAQIVPRCLNKQELCPI